MSDEELRKKQRLARLGDPSALEALRAANVRSGRTDACPLSTAEYVCLLLDGHGGKCHLVPRAAYEAARDPRFLHQSARRYREFQDRRGEFA